MARRMLAGFEARLDGEAILRGDQGWRCRMPARAATLKRMGAAQSMPRKGECLDNAKAEGFFSMVKAGVRQDWTGGTVEDLDAVLTAYIRRYNNDRIKMRLEGCGPVEYRLNRSAGVI